VFQGVPCPTLMEISVKKPTRARLEEGSLLVVFATAEP
jgi:hypothetical protein